MPPSEGHQGSPDEPATSGAGPAPPDPPPPDEPATSGVEPAPPDLLPPDLDRLRAELVRAVSRVCPPWLADRADDIVQVALIRIADLHKKSEGPVLFTSSYLRKAAFNAVVDETRRRRRRQEVALIEENLQFQPASGAPDPERQAASREAGRAIRGCLARLIRPRRLAVTLHLQGHSVPDLARRLGWSAKRAENLVYRGLADLRSCLERSGVRA